MKWQGQRTAWPWSASAIKRYNDAVAVYNHTARGFLAFLRRPLLGFPRQQVYFQISEEAKKAPTF
jgi:hypothetical protein